MLNFKYLSNVFLYFFSNVEIGYVFLLGFYYLIQDYFVLVFSLFNNFSMLPLIQKENLKFLIFFFVYISCII